MLGPRKRCVNAPVCVCASVILEQGRDFYEGRARVYFAYLELSWGSGVEHECKWVSGPSLRGEKLMRDSAHWEPEGFCMGCQA